jgi:hypothetical protein
VRITHADEAGLGPVLPKLAAVASIALWLAVAIPARLIGLVG